MKKLISQALGRVTRRVIAHSIVLVGGGVVAAGTAMVALPAGIIVGGLFLAGWALLVFDVEGNS